MAHQRSESRPYHPPPLLGFPPARPGRRTTVVAALGSTLVASMLVSATPATSAVDSQCPAAYPTAKVARGMNVTGLTVSAGTEPDRFTGTVLGRIQDGIAPGIDMIMAQLSGSVITDADGDVDRGVWAGMSGSPVYAEDGRLIGAVSYGLSWSPSDVAGITPAADMKALLDSGAGARLAGTRTVAVPQAVRQHLVSTDAISTQQASAGFSRLPLPLGVSGMSGSRLEKVAEKLGLARKLAKRDLQMYATGSGAAAAPSAIRAGGNLAASLSYGDITAAGVGTTTAVCGEEVLAFGHPMLWSGASELTLHGADAIYVQRDDVFGSFKVANPTAPAGGILEDRLAGLRGLLGADAVPSATEVSAHVERVDGRSSRDGTTHVSVPRYTPFLAAIHLLANADTVFDQIGAGTARVRWTVEGVREDGGLFEYSRVNRYASQYDITFASIIESYFQLRQLIDNRFDKVRLTDISYRAIYDPDYRAYHVSRLAIRRGGEWVNVKEHSRTTVTAGKTVRMRATLRPARAWEAGETRKLRFSVDVPRGSAGSSGELIVFGGGRAAGKAESFNELLDQLANAPRNNDVSGALRLRGEEKGGRYEDRDMTTISEVVSGHVDVRVRVVK